MKIKLLFLAITITAIACSKNGTHASQDNNDPGSTGAFSEPGYGSSTRPFNAPGWQLPSGVQLEDSIHDYSYCWAFPPYTQVPQKDWKGVPVGFPFCITLRNTGSQPIVIQFPPELVFVSSSIKHQNVLVIQLGSVELSAGITKTIVAQAFCINKGRTIPETFEEGTQNFLVYSFGPSQVPAALKEVTDIVESKHITMADVTKADGTIDNSKTAKYAVIQAAIWEVTDEQGLTAATRQKLHDL